MTTGVCEYPGCAVTATLACPRHWAVVSGRTRRRLQRARRDQVTALRLQAAVEMAEHARRMQVAR